MSVKHLRCVAVLLLAGLSLPAQAVVVSDGQGAFLGYRPSQATAKPQAPAHAPRWTYRSIRNKPEVVSGTAPKRRLGFGSLMRNPAVPAAIAGASAVEVVRQFNARAREQASSVSQKELDQLINWMTRGTGRNYGGARLADTLRKAGPTFEGLSDSERRQLANIADRAKAIVAMKKMAAPGLFSQRGDQGPLAVDSRFADMLLRISGSKPAASGDMRVSKPFVPSSAGTLMLRTGEKLSYADLRKSLTTGALRDSGGSGVAMLLDRFGTDLTRMSKPERAQLHAAIGLLGSKAEVMAKEMPAMPDMPRGSTLLKLAEFQANIANKQIASNQATVRFLQNWITQ